MDLQIANRQPLFLPDQQLELSKQITVMDHIAQVTARALDEQSDIHSYAVYKVVSTLALVNKFKNAYSNEEIPPEIEDYIHQQTQNYLEIMERIPQDACNKILQVLQGVSVTPNEIGILDELRSIILRMLIE